MQQSLSRGFTFVEMIVTIAIIGLLAAVVFGALSGSREKARDIERLNNITQLSIALRLYAEQYGEYPNAASDPSYPDCVPSTSFSPTGCLQVLVQEGFISTLAYEDMLSEVYRYDNWCDDTTPGNHPDNYRVWVGSETNQGSAQTSGGKWWTDYFIGATTCEDPV